MIDRMQTLLLGLKIFHFSSTYAFPFVLQLLPPWTATSFSTMANALDTNYQIYVVMHDDITHEREELLDLHLTTDLRKCFLELQGPGWILLKDGRKGNKEGNTATPGAPWSENKVSAPSVFERRNLTDQVCSEHPISHQPLLWKHLAYFRTFEIFNTARAPIARGRPRGLEGPYHA